MSLYDIETEEETIQIIRVQNKKIQELFSELERKDEHISQLQNDNKELDSQIDNQKRQIFTLNEKMKVLEYSLQDNQNILNNHFKKACEVESKYKCQVSSKENVIAQMGETIRQYENQINKLKSEVNEKNLSMNKLKNENEDLQLNIKNYILKISLFEDEIKFLTKEKEDKENKVVDSKMRFEEKAEELVDLVKQQYGELNRMSGVIRKLENENMSYKNINNKYKSEMTDLLGNISELKENCNKFKEMEERMKETELLVKDLHGIIEAERKKNLELNVNVEGLNMKNSDLVGKLSEMESIKNELVYRDEEIANLTKQINSCKEYIKRLETQIKENENENLIVLSAVNDYILNLTQWADTYIGVYITSNSSDTNCNPEHHIKAITSELIQDIHNNHNKLSSNMSKCTETVVNIQKRIKADVTEYENFIQELKIENSQITEKHQSLLNENSNLKNEKLSQNEEIYSKLENFSKIKNELNYYKDLNSTLDSSKSELELNYKGFLTGLLSDFKSMYEKIKDNRRISDKTEFVFSHLNPMNENIKNQVRDYFDNFVELLKYLIKEHEILSTRLEDLSKLKLDCEKFKTEFETYKKNSQFENELLKKEHSEKIRMLEHEKMSETKRLNEEHKFRIEKLKTTISDKEEIIDKLRQDYELINSQLNLVEKNFENYKHTRKISEDELKNKVEELEGVNKQLEKEICKLKSELEMRILSLQNVENKKNTEIEDIKSKAKSKNEELENKIQELQSQLDNSMNREKESTRPEIKQLELENQKLKFEIRELVDNNKFITERIAKIEKDKRVLNNMNNSQNNNQDAMKEYEERIKLAEEELKLKDFTIRRLVNEMRELNTKSTSE